MEIVEGKVSNYKGHGDIFRNYGKIDDEIKYYFLDYSAFSNGNLIATTDLVEAIDSEVAASHIGLVDKDGNVVIPLENKSIKPLNDNIILVEKAVPTSKSVLDSIELSKNNNGAASLVALTNACKNKVMAKLGAPSELVFHNQLSEASIFDINGKNLVNNEYYSYIGVNDSTIFLGKNVEDSPIFEFSLTNPEQNINNVPGEVPPVATNTDPVIPAGGQTENAVTPDVPANPVVEAPTENVSTPEVPVADVPSEGNPEPVNADASVEDSKEVNNTVDGANGDIPEVVSSEEVQETVEESNDTDNSVDLPEVKEDSVVEEEESSEESDEEEDSENTDDNEKESASSKLDDLFTEGESLDSSEEDESDEKFTETDEDNRFSDFSVEKIDTDSYNFDDSKYDDLYEPISSSDGDDVLLSAGKVMESLINQNRRQRSELNKLNLELDKANNNIRLKKEQLETAENRLEIATNKLRNLDTVVNKLENKNSMLNSKLEDQKRTLESQKRDIASKDKEIENLKSQIQGKEDLARFVADAKSLLSENDY